MALKDIGEFGFIDRIKPGCLIRNRNVLRGIGDDCAVLRTSEGLVTLFTTDMLVDEVHFLLEKIPPYKLGRKSIAVNLSDIAAMGGTPTEALVSIAIPDSLEVGYLDALYQGMKSIAREFDLNVLGGDTSRAPANLVISVAMLGEAKEEEVLYRSGARPGDLIFTTGCLGSSAAGLDAVLEMRTYPGVEELVEAHYNPQPHVAAGRLIAGSKAAHALIDVSDGVAADLGHICMESGVGAVIDEEKIPTNSLFRAYCEHFHLDFRQLSLYQGEDYVLLGTVTEDAAPKIEQVLRSAGFQFLPIGTIVSGSGLRLKQSNGSVRQIAGRGWQHF